MKKYLKKSLSTFLAFLMVFTSLVFVVPEVAPEAEAATTAYNMPAAPAPDTYIKMAKSGWTGQYFAIKYPSAIYLDKTETLQGVGYYINFADWQYLNNDTGDGRRMFILPSLWGGVGAESDVLHAQAFNSYGITFSTTLGTDGYDGGTAYYQEINKSKTTYTQNVKGSLQGTPKAEQVGKTLTYSLTGEAKLWESHNSKGYNSDDNPKDWTKNYTITGKTDVITGEGGSTGANISISITIYDKSELKSKIDTAKGYTTGTNVAKYTPESVNALKNMISNAEDLLKKRETTQSEIDNMKADLQEAIDNLSVAMIDVNFENLFSFADWCAQAPDFDGKVTKDIAKGKLTLKNDGTTPARDGNGNIIYKENGQQQEGEQTLKSPYKVYVEEGKTYTIEYVRGEELNTDVYFFFNDIADEKTGLFKDSENRLSTDQKGVVQSREFTVPSGVTYLTIRFDANWNEGSENSYSFYDLKIYESSRRDGVSFDSDRIALQPDKDTWKAVVGELPTATKPGYNLVGWYTMNNDGDLSDSPLTPETELGASTTYYAKWTPVKNVAEFYTYDGQPYMEVSGDYNTAISAVVPTAPALEPDKIGSYTFYRWVNMETGHIIKPDANGVYRGYYYDGKDYVLHEELFDNVNEGATVAKYRAEYISTINLPTYTVNFKNEYDNDYSYSVSGKFNKPIDKDKLPPIPTRTHEDPGYEYVFIGWSLNKEEGSEVIIGANDLFRFLDDETYYAQFELKPAEYDIKANYIEEDGTATTIAYDNKNYKSYVELFNPPVWNDGVYSYEFSHWVDSKGNEYTPSGKTTMVQVLGDETYTAKYNKTDIYYLAYFYNGNELLDYRQELKVGDFVTVPEDIETPTKDRVGNTTYEFDDWYLYDAETGT